MELEMEDEHQDNSNLPVWRSFGRDSRIEVVPDDEEDELILAQRNNCNRNIPVISLPNDLECVAEIERNCRMLRKCLLGRLQDGRYFSTDYLQAMLEKVWNIKRERLFVRGQCEGTLLITFEDREERDSVLEGSPWNVNGSLLMLAPWQTDVVMTKYRIEKAPFWIQIHGLPEDFHSAETVAKVGMVAGEVRLIDWPENSPYMRVRTIINPDEPLVAGVYLTDQDGEQKHWVEFRYERAFVLCHRCGVIGHMKRDCTISTSDMNLRAQSKIKEIRAKLCRRASAAKGLSFLVKLHGGCEFLIKGIAATSQQARRPAGRYFQTPNDGWNFGSKEIHSNKQGNHASSSKPKMEWRPKKKEGI